MAAIRVKATETATDNADIKSVSLDSPFRSELSSADDSVRPDTSALGALRAMARRIVSFAGSQITA